MDGFSDNEILDIRNGEAAFNEKYNALAAYVKETVIERGKPSQEIINNLFDAG